MKNLLLLTALLLSACVSYQTTPMNEKGESWVIETRNKVFFSEETLFYCKSKSATTTVPSCTDTQLLPNYAIPETTQSERAPIDKESQRYNDLVKKRSRTK